MPSIVKVRAEQDQRFKIFHSLGFQGNPNEALDLICCTLRSLEFVSGNNLLTLLWKAERSWLINRYNLGRIGKCQNRKIANWNAELDWRRNLYSTMRKWSMTSSQESSCASTSAFSKNPTRLRASQEAMLRTKEIARALLYSRVILSKKGKSANFLQTIWLTSSWLKEHHWCSWISARTFSAWCKIGSTCSSWNRCSSSST